MILGIEDHILWSAVDDTWNKEALWSVIDDIGIKGAQSVDCGAVDKRRSRKREIGAETRK